MLWIAAWTPGFLALSELQLCLARPHRSFDGSPLKLLSSEIKRLELLQLFLVCKFRSGRMPQKIATRRIHRWRFCTVPIMIVSPNRFLHNGMSPRFPTVDKPSRGNQHENYDVVKPLPQKVSPPPLITRAPTVLPVHFTGNIH